MHGRRGVAHGAAARFDDAPLLGIVLEDRFALLGFVGGGGMGAVYRAWDERLERDVAVKVLNSAALASREARERFGREAKALSRLQSDHTVRIFDFGLVQSGPYARTAYMVMELVAGESLADRLRRGRVPLEQSIDIVNQIGESLAEAHGQGIVHRDLKPDNILLVRRSDARIVVKLIDFGIARMDDGRSTKTGLLVGTPLYMSPEQCEGRAGVAIGPATDQYALGILAYELLSGRLPFIGESVNQILLAHCQKPAPPLPPESCGTLTSQLDAVVSRVLAKNSGARFETIEAFAQALALAARWQGPAARSSDAPAPGLAPGRGRSDDQALAPTLAPPTTPSQRVIAPSLDELPGMMDSDADMPEEATKVHRQWPATALMAESLAESSGQLTSRNSGAAPGRKRLLIGVGVAACCVLAAAITIIVMMRAPGQESTPLPPPTAVVVAVPAAPTSLAAVERSEPSAPHAPAPQPAPSIAPTPPSFADQPSSIPRPSSAARTSVAAAAPALRRKTGPTVGAPTARTAPTAPPAAAEDSPPRVAEIPQAAREVQAALRSCQCSVARERLNSVPEFAGLGQLRRAVIACRAPDVDEACVDGHPVAQ